jgi:hypothetical protein
MSKQLDSQIQLTTEEELDRQMRWNGTWNLSAWRQKRTMNGGQDDKLIHRRGMMIGMF